ncbi:type II toxin-antitoxin system death-on-curing family toxin [Paenibacillus antibioticophila]|uniref:type II toxin-antitoxin system death-on-curing family toxin n=1 Tax=Paenibacillus antibioticophila TaxID=1274374 RepID=UPI0009DC0BFC
MNERYSWIRYFHTIRENFNAYPTIFEKAAAMLESLGQNHPFHNANKRTAFTALVVFLRFNGLHFKMDTKKAEDFTVDMVNHRFDFQEMVSIIEAHCIAVPNS